jgi:pyruvate kinase
LSPETAVGKGYELAVETIGHICFEAEQYINYKKRYAEQQNLFKISSQESIQNFSMGDAIASCAVKASFNVKASLIIVFTHSGLSARKIAKHAPKCPILAVSPNDWAA